MNVQFVSREDGPERLLCDAELLFDESGPLSGMKLVGFALWRNAEGGVSVTLPARSWGVGPERRFFDLLRSCEGKTDSVKRFKAWLTDQFQAQPRT